MATAVAAPTSLLQEPELKARLQQFRQPDNVTNWYYLLRTYLFLAVVIGGSVWFLHAPGRVGPALGVGHPGRGRSGRADRGGAAPVDRAGPRGVAPHAVQEQAAQRTGVGLVLHVPHAQHDAPLPAAPPGPSSVRQRSRSATRTCRRFGSMAIGPNFPMTRAEFWRELAKQIWPLNLIRYLRAQAKSNAMAGHTFAVRADWRSTVRG